MKLQGKVCVVTGGAHGIGRALCERFVAEGAAAVVVSDRDGDAAREVASRLRGLAPKAAAGVAQAVVTDVSQEREIAALVQATLAAHGRIDLFVSNAGIAVGGGAEAPDADWQRAWDVNVMAHVWGARHVLPSMLARGKGSVVCTSSISAVAATPMEVLYGATKGAVHQFVRGIATEYRDRGIRCNAVCPGFIRTPHGLREVAELQALGVDTSAATIAAQQGRMYEPDEVARAALFLASDEASFVNGTHLFVDNTFTAV